MSSQRSTIQRKVIHDTLVRMQSHPTIDELYTEIKKEYPSISKTTIYRNLHTLTQSGRVRLVALADGPARYDGRHFTHYHFTCSECGAIFDVDIPHMDKLNDDVAAKHDFLVKDHDVVFTGLCSECRGV